MRGARRRRIHSVKRSTEVRMPEAYTEEKAHQGGGSRPGGKWCRTEGNGTQGTGRAGSAKPARSIGDHESGQGRQMRRGASFCGLRHFTEHVRPQLMARNARRLFDGKNSISRNNFPLRDRLRRYAERSRDIRPAACGVSGTSQSICRSFSPSHGRGYKHNLNLISRYS